MGRDILERQLPHTLAESDIPGLGVPQRNGARDIYDLGDFCLVVLTDRILDGERLVGTAPFKGEMITRIATWWSDVLGDVAPTAIERILEPQALLVRKLPEWPARYSVFTSLDGSLWQSYSEGLRQIDGLELPDGLSLEHPLERPVVIADNEAPPEGAELARRLFVRGQQLAKERGVSLLETRYHFAIAGEEPVPLDLLHTPCVSRYRSVEGEMLTEESVLGASHQAPKLTDSERLALGELYIRLGGGFASDFTPRAAPVINRLSHSLSHIGLVA